MLSSNDVADLKELLDLIIKINRKYQSPVLDELILRLNQIDENEITIKSNEAFIYVMNIIDYEDYSYTCAIGSLISLIKGKLEYQNRIRREDSIEELAALINQYNYRKEPDAVINPLITSSEISLSINVIVDELEILCNDSEEKNKRFGSVSWLMDFFDIESVVGVNSFINCLQTLLMLGFKPYGSDIEYIKNIIKREKQRPRGILFSRILAEF
jgi:hypothetical protein